MKRLQPFFQLPDRACDEPAPPPIDDDRVDDGENAEADQHPDIGQVVGETGHEIAGPFLVEIVQIKHQQAGIKIVADLVLNPPGCVQEGGAGEYSDDTVEQGDRNDCPAVPGGRVAGRPGSLDALDCQLQQPGDQEGKAVGSDQEKCPDKVAAAVFSKVAYEKGKLLNSAPLFVEPSQKK